MEKEELDRILELHKMWLSVEESGVYADLRDADLRWADLNYADLRSANLSNADLRDADLRDADLKYTDLSNADLSNADLKDANLKYADLSNADLSNADLRYCIGNGKEIKSLQIGTYLISYTKNILNIGCQSHTLDEWKSFTNTEIEKMDSNALEWWKLNKHIIIELAEREIK